MTTRTIVILAVVGLLVLNALGYGCSCLGYRQDCVQAEAGLKAQYDQNRNNYDNMWKKFREFPCIGTAAGSSTCRRWRRPRRSRARGPGGG